VFVSPADYPDACAEKARYDQHHNNPIDKRYRTFLQQLATPLLERLTVGSIGLDFGCGPGPALAHILQESGMTVELYDPYYCPNDTAWTTHYDFVTATEVVEHLHQPSQEFDRLFRVLKPGGRLAIMTKWVSRIPSFATSRYVRDMTHVCLYSPETFNWIASRWNSSVDFPKTDIALFQKD
tara:strand:- start:112 stop:654 length:543 start_codon:yes stop_codon:yes gene_type:complete